MLGASDSSPYQKLLFTSDRDSIEGVMVHLRDGRAERGAGGGGRSGSARS